MIPLVRKKREKEKMISQRKATTRRSLVQGHKKRARGKK